LSLEAMRQYKVRFPDEHTKTLVIKDKILELAEYLGKTIIFVRTRNSACILHRALVDTGYPITTTQGAVTPEDIDKIVQEFKNNIMTVLISTDLLAGGFDKQQELLPHLSPFLT
jgi:ATP-dependent RNA helicase DDX19/DBP5